MMKTETTETINHYRTMTDTEIKKHAEEMADFRADFWRIWLVINPRILLAGGLITRDRQLIAAERGAWEMFRQIKCQNAADSSGRVERKSV